VVQRDTRPGADIDYFSAAGRSFAGQQVCLHHIVDVGEIARLFTVAENNRVGFFQESSTEFREHA
jgi:hypothetical protein